MFLLVYFGRTFYSDPIMSTYMYTLLWFSYNCLSNPMGEWWDFSTNLKSHGRKKSLWNTNFYVIFSPIIAVNRILFRRTMCLGIGISFMMIIQNYICLDADFPKRMQYYNYIVLYIQYLNLISWLAVICNMAYIKIYMYMYDFNAIEYLSLDRFVKSCSEKRNTIPRWW